MYRLLSNTNSLNCPVIVEGNIEGIKQSFIFLTFVSVSCTTKGARETVFMEASEDVLVDISIFCKLPVVVHRVLM